MKKVVRLTETELHRIINESVRDILCEVYTDDDELQDELAAVGARGGATDKQIFGWEEDLWININKTMQNALYLFNKTRDERYAKIEGIVSKALELFPKDASNKFMGVDYDPEEGYGG